MTIQDLVMQDGRVYARLFTGDPLLVHGVGRGGGLHLFDGVKPTKRVADEIMAVNRDLTINYVGMFGRTPTTSGKRPSAG